MNTTQKLGIALAVQVGLAALTWWPRGETEVVTKDLVEGGGNAITELTVVSSAENAKPVTLKSENGTWTITTSSGFPADADKVGEVLDVLGGIKLRTPVASQATSHVQLKVADDTFDKKITFTANGQQHTVLVGAAASKAVYVRVDGAAEVYEAKGVSAWALKDNDKGYLPVNFVDIDREQVTALTLTNAKGTLKLSRDGDTWQVLDVPSADPAAAPGPAPADASKVSDLLDKALKIRLGEPVGTDVKAEYGLDAPTVSLSWTSSDGTTTHTGSVAIGTLVDGKYYVKADAGPFVVFSPSYRIDDLVNADPATYVGTGAPPVIEGEPPPGLEMVP